MSDLTHILSAGERGESRASEELLPLVYDELRRLAAYRLAHELPGQTLQATALVHEAYLRLLHVGCDQWEDSRQFFNAAAEAMRRILIDNARRKKCSKHGGDFARSNLDDLDLPAATPRDVDTGGPTPDEYAGLLTPLDANKDGIPDTWYRDANGDGVNDLIVDLGTYKRMEMSIVYTHGLNEVGTVLGSSATYAHHFYDASAWLWQNGVLQSLQDLTGGTFVQFAYAINDAGQIIAGAPAACILLPTR